MSDKKSSRVLINLIGVPSLIGIIILGDDTFQLPIFSLFVLIVLLLGVREMPVLIESEEFEIREIFNFQDEIRIELVRA